MEEIELIDPDELLLGISRGEALEQETEEAIAGLFQAALNPGKGRSPSVDDVYAYITVIGKAKLTSFRVILERFLDTQDPLTVALVLEILCLDWQAAEDYLERVISFALGASWDSEDDVRQAALRILGEYLAAGLAAEVLEAKKQAKNPEKIVHCRRVLELLLATFDDAETEQWVRQRAYFALCRAAGKSEEELPSECVPLDFEDGVDKPMLEHVRTLVAELGYDLS